MFKKFMSTKFFFTVVFVLIGVATVWNIGKRFSENDAYIEHVSIPSVSALDGIMFNRLYDGGAIWVSLTSNSLQIEHTPCSSQVLSAPELGVLMDDKPAGPDSKRLIAELCSTDQGKRLRERITEFNRGFRLVGIRDNRLKAEAEMAGGAPKCANGVVAHLYLPTGCAPDAWTVTTEGDGRRLKMVAPSTIPLNEYAFLASAQNRFFGDWEVVSPQWFTGSGDEKLSFVSTLPLGRTAIQIQSIGNVTALRLGDSWFNVEDGKLSTMIAELDMGRVSASVESFCPDESEAAGRADPIRCSPQQAGGRPIGSMVEISGSKGVELEVELVVAPSVIIPKRLRLKNLKKAAPTKLGTGALRMECAFTKLPPSGVELHGQQQTGCDLTWENLETNEKPEADGSIYFPFTQDGIEILDDKGNLTQGAFEMGLADVMGFGVQDVGSLAAALLGTKASKEFQLSLNLRMQQAAQQALDALKVCGGRTIGCKERVDMVILNAEGEKAGEVLAVVGSPRPQVGMSSWDIAALEFADGARSPLAANAWRRHNNIGTPGSSFKLVTALAASQRALDTQDKVLLDYLMGTKDLRGLTRDFQIFSANDFSATTEHCTGLSQLDPKQAQTLVVKGVSGGDTIARCITDTSSKPVLGRLFQPGKVTGCRNSTEEEKEERLGMCEALWKSSNIYFGGLSLYLDQDKLLIPNTDREHDAEVDLVIQNMASRLFPTLKDARQASPDAYPFDVFNPAHQATFRGRPSAPSVDARLTTVPPEDLEKRRDTGRFYPSAESRRLRLAQAGFGQSVSATPMTMAAVAASIATGRVVRPHGVPLKLRNKCQDPQEGKPLLIASKSQEQQANALLYQIRNGMRAAVHKSGGTTTSLKDVKGLKIWAKSGTATIVEHSNNDPLPYALWVVGYAEPTQDGALIDRRVAFACRRAPAKGNGGEVCGLIVKKVLEAIMSVP